MAEVDLTKKKQREIKKEIKRLEEIYKDIDVKKMTDEQRENFIGIYTI